MSEETTQGTAPAPTPRPDESASLERVLFRHGTLFDLDIGRWMARKKLRSADLLLDASMEATMQWGHKILLPKEAMKDIQELDSRARAYLANRSVQFPIGGGRFVAAHALTEVIERLRSMREAYHVAVGVLIEKYPELRNAQIVELDKTAYNFAVEEQKKNPTPENWQRLADWLTQEYTEHRSMYPAPDELRRRFRFEWRMFRIDPSSGIEGMNEEQAEEMRRAQNQLRQELQQWVRQASAEMHQTLGAAALNASQLLARNGKLDPRNLRPLFEAFEAFRAMDFTGQSAFQEAVTRARSAFVVDENGAVDFQKTAETLNAESAKAAFNELLGTMGSLAEQAVADEAGVRAIRSSGAFARVVDI